MGRFILLLALCCLLWTGAAAGDVILKRSGEQIEAIVKEITDTEVKYKKMTNPDGVTYSVSRGNVFSITYQNGSRDVFADEKMADVGGYPYPPVSRSYSLGDLFDEGGVRGIVIHAADGGRHGLVMSLDEEKLGWGSITDNPFKDGFVSGSTDEADGWKNMLAIRDLMDNTELSWLTVPAFAWCRDLGPGWYLPARREMEYICAFGDENPAHTWKEFKLAIENLNSKLIRYGGNEFSAMMWHWSSTEKDAKKAYYFTFINEPFKGYTKGREKFFQLRVRAVHKF
jgi:hypothetical protein